MDDRPLEDPAQAIGRIDAKIADLESTLLARLVRRPVGDMEPTIRSAPKANTLILNGALVSRTTYAALWSWAQANTLVVTGLFTTGDGSTTFGLPDMRGRVPIGVGTLGSDTYALGQIVGASAKVISLANLPAHDHNVSVSLSQHEGHSHAINGAGGHGGHFPGDRYLAAGGTALGLADWQSSGNDNGSHSHSMSIEGGGKPHSVSVNESPAGSGTAFDVRQASLAINWLIWV